MPVTFSPQRSAEPVKGRRGLAEFIELPYRLHGGDPHFVPPLRGDCRRLLDRRRNPFFRYGDAELFTVRREGRVAGRIAAVHNPRHNAAHGTHDGFFGQFACADDPGAARELLDAAAAWLRGRGLQTMLGPVDFTMNDECGVLVDGFDAPPSVMMPYNPAYYPELLESGGLAKVKDLWAWDGAGREPHERLLRIARRAEQRHRLTVRSLDPARFDADLDGVKRVFDSAWQGNWGFTPMTDEEFAAAKHRLRKVVDPRLVLLAEVAGEPVAVALMLPDLNQAVAAARGRLSRFGLPIGRVRLTLAARRIDRVRGVLFGVVPALRRHGVEAAVIARAYEAIAAGGYRGGVELGWTLEDNQAINRYLALLGCTRSKVYRIYGREL
ncbi:GNAT family N-acetyltransferase [Nonomuraea monospora]|uniref:GNAT family N-acetyltransferase n=1 Tax=Nonomuraea monospora TaxID=568818 RepID=A0ABN3CSL0_9ACTN